MKLIRKAQLGIEIPEAKVDNTYVHTFVPEIRKRTQLEKDADEYRRRLAILRQYNATHQLTAYRSKEKATLLNAANNLTIGINSIDPQYKQGPALVNSGLYTGALSYPNLKWIFTNPWILGGLALEGGYQAIKGKEGILKTKEYLDRNKYGSALMSGTGDVLDLAGLTAIGAPLSTMKLLPFLNKASNSVNVLPSGSKPILIPKYLESDKLNLRNWIKKFNKWNSHYGYSPIPLKLSLNPDLADDAIKARLLEHNTFVRGVRDANDKQVIDKVNKILLQQGLEPTFENRLKYFATTYAPETGAGRAGFYHHHNNIGPIYTSNSLATGKGYAEPHHYKEKSGKIFKVQRNIDLSGKDRDLWILNADFDFDNDPSIYYKFELPYLLKYGESPRTKLILLKKQNIDYNLVLNNIYEIVNQRAIIPSESFKNISDKLFLLKKEGFKYLPNSLINGIRNPENNLANSRLLQELYNIPTIDEVSQLKVGLYHYMLDFLEKKNIDSQKLGYFSVKTNDNGDYVLEGVDDPFGSGLFDPPVPVNIAEKLVIPKNEFNLFLMKDIQGKIGKTFSKNHWNKLVLQSKNDINKQVLNLLRKRYKLSDKEIIDFVTNSGINPSTKDSHIITTEPFRRTSRNNGNPYMHFIFTGPVGKKGLNIVGEINPEDIDGISSRAHIGKATEGFSRKSRKFGGKLKLIPRHEINK